MQAISTDCDQARSQRGGGTRGTPPPNPSAPRLLFLFEIILSALILYFLSQYHRGDGNGCC